MFSLKQEQELPISIEEAWSFFSNPTNLKEITPDYMGFTILNKPAEKMYPGQIIQYLVKPVLGIPLKWVTEISHVQEPFYFVDTQLLGPYKVWHHQHHFESLKHGGVRMIDEVNYLPPLGLLGKLANALFIQKQLKEIFDYRYQYLEKRFNSV